MDILLPAEHTSLYIHIPFCRKKCSYCDFYSIQISSDSEVEPVLDRILIDTEIFLQKLNNPEIRTVFIGGGTPSIVKLEILENFLSKLANKISDRTIEYTIELNPETVTPDLLHLLESCGINRLSIGVQSLDNNSLMVLGRNADLKVTLKALEMVSRIWNGALNFDLINSVPGQSVTAALSDIKSLHAFNPDQISLYNLSIEPDTILYNQLESGSLESISEDTDGIIQRESIKLLNSLGYDRYEIACFSQKGHASQHNLNYWNLGHYIGVGPSAASTLMSLKGPVRISFHPDIANYIGSDFIKKRIDYEILSAESFLLEHFIMGFRLIKGIDINHINRIFDIDLTAYLKPLLDKWGEYITFNNSFVRLTEEGLFLLNPLLADLASLIEISAPLIPGEQLNW